jgi:hypothetical protein
MHFKVNLQSQVRFQLTFVKMYPSVVKTLLQAFRWYRSLITVDTSRSWQWYRSVIGWNKCFHFNGGSEYGYAWSFATCWVEKFAPRTVISYFKFAVHCSTAPISYGEEYPLVCLEPFDIAGYLVGHPIPLVSSVAVEKNCFVDICFHYGSARPSYFQFT